MCTFPVNYWPFFKFKAGVLITTPVWGGGGGGGVIVHPHITPSRSGARAFKHTLRGDDPDWSLMVLSSFNNGNNTRQSWEMIPSHIKSLRWSFHLPSDPHSLLTLIVGAFCQRLTGAIPLTPVLGLIGARVRTHCRQRRRDALEANSVICFLHLPSLPTNSTHLCQPPPPLVSVPPSQPRDKENNEIRRERQRERERRGVRQKERRLQHSIREKFSPQFSLLPRRKCCTCLHLLCLTCCRRKMSALIRQNKFLANTGGGGGDSRQFGLFMG